MFYLPRGSVYINTGTSSICDIDLSFLVYGLIIQLLIYNGMSSEIFISGVTIQYDFILLLCSWGTF
jgi:hypothetical protein